MDSTSADNAAAASALSLDTSNYYPVDKLRDMLDTATTDFHQLLSLIQQVDHSFPNDIGAINLIYDKFLAEYPLCYASWIKYGAHKMRLCGPHEVVQVYERAVQAVTFSVDLWCNYCTFGVLMFEDPSDVRRLFERALSFVGKDYLCHQIWDKYIEFEYTHKQWHRLANIYINILKFPTKKLHVYYESFKKLTTLLEEEASIQGFDLASPSDPNQNGERVEVLEISDTSSVVQGFVDADSHKVDIDTIKKYLWAGEKLYRRSREIEENIVIYESNITRHYFHVNPLDDSQLQNWHQYLNFVETQGDFDWMVKLYERCLIPCANYPEFWIRYMDFVYSQGGREIANSALDRSPPSFHKKVPSYRMYCAMLKEEMGDLLGARSLLLHDFSRFSSNYIKDICREANLERRKGNMKGAFQLYENEIEIAVEKKNLEVAANLYMNFAQFTFVATGSKDAAREIYVKGIKEMPCKSIIKGLIQFEMAHGRASQIPILDLIISNAIESRIDGSAPLSYEERKEISMLFFDFVDLYGETAQIRKAWARHCVLFPIESRNIFAHKNSSSNDRAKLEKNMGKNDSSPNQIPLGLDEAKLGGEEVILQPNFESTVLMEAEQGEELAKEGEKLLEQCSFRETQIPESKTSPTVIGHDYNHNINDGPGNPSDIKKTDLVRANIEPESIEQKPDRSSQATPITVSTEISRMCEQVGMQTQPEMAPGQALPISGQSLFRPSSSVQGKHSEPEMESDQAFAFSHSKQTRSSNSMPTSLSQDTSQSSMALPQPSQILPTEVFAQSLNGGVQSGQDPSQMWQYNQQQLQQMYYYLQLQQQQLQQQMLQQNQVQPSLSSPNNTLQEKQQQLQQQMMYYQQMYQMYLQQSMQVQQQHWFQFQQQQMAQATSNDVKPICKQPAATAAVCPRKGDASG
ncbi:hypothetical protein LUZ61_013050 [Rhynchospora tenuis]|uniref:Pre-mRNA-processing factor 39 n=1 Tax=Rhynchospora tenuis TaxID=198213 RepID=A0AAD6F256_9POAL|nr:hypothetical protein LUZ61_013050 [Rhynchospora tenuis]